MAELTRTDPKVAIDPRPTRDYSLDRVASAGNDIRGLARSLMTATEPGLRKRANDKALEAAGSADIVQDAEGNWIRPERRGGGLVYAEAYDRAMDQRYLGVVSNDLEEQLTAIGIEHRDDPEAFRAKATGLVTGTLEKINPRVRADLDLTMTREVSERYRGIATQAANQKRDALITGLRAQIDLNQKRATLIASVGGADADIRAGAELSKNVALYGSLRDLGVVSAEGADALGQTDLVEAAPALMEAASERGMLTIAGGMNGMTDAQLRWYADVGATGLPLDGKPYGLSDKDYWQAVPSERSRAILGAQAVNENNRDPSSMTQVEVAAEEATREQGGNVFTRLNSREGRNAELHRIQQTGYVSKATADVVASLLQSDQMSRVAEFANNLRSLKAGSTNYAVGENWYNSLPGNVKSALHLESVGRRLGMPQKVVQQMVRQAVTGENVLSKDETRARYGKGYDAIRGQALGKALGIPETAANANPNLIRDYDEIVGSLLTAYQGDAARASVEAAQAISRGYFKSELFVGGVGPKNFQVSNINAYQLNTLPVLRNRETNPQGARFGQKTSSGLPRVQLQPRFTNQRGGYGEYDVIINDPSGRRLAAYPVNLTAEWGTHGPPQVAAEKPKGDPGDWILVHDKKIFDRAHNRWGQNRFVRRGQVQADPARYGQTK